MSASSPRIVSLLPSATEIVYALGQEDRLVGRTFECDYPSAAEDKEVVLESTIPSGLTPPEIDAFVRSAGGSSGLYTISDNLGALAPDVILTQDLCGVCAVPVSNVEEALDALNCRSQVLSLDPRTLDQVITAIEDVGEALGVPDRARDLTSKLQSRLDDVGKAVADRVWPTVAVIEWVGPPFGSGHWIPQMVEVAGGRPVLGHPGAPSTTTTWDRIAESSADVLLIAPCGYYLDDAWQQARQVLGRPELAGLPAVRNGAVYAVDATSIVTRPGPRVVDGVEAFASVLHPGATKARPGLIRHVGE